MKKKIKRPSKRARELGGLVADVLDSVQETDEYEELIESGRPDARGRPVSKKELLAVPAVRKALEKLAVNVMEGMLYMNEGDPDGEED